MDDFEAKVNELYALRKELESTKVRLELAEAKAILQDVLVKTGENLYNIEEVRAFMDIFASSALLGDCSVAARERVLADPVTEHERLTAKAKGIMGETAPTKKEILN